MAGNIQPLNVVVSTLIIQFLFVSMLSVAALTFRGARLEDPGIFRRGEVVSGDYSKARLVAVLFLALISFAILFVSDVLHGIWSPFFNGMEINSIPAANAIGVVFYIDLLLVSFLIYTTGGSESSPFLTAFFTLPALAIFLRLPSSFFVIYSGIVVLVYFILFYKRYGYGTDNMVISKGPTIFVNVCCLLLSVFTGYITRPVSIDNLNN